MSLLPVVDKIRIIPRPSDFLDRNVGASGEVFFNSSTNSLRVYSGKDRSGFEIARSDLSNIKLDDLKQTIASSGIATVVYHVTVEGPQGSDTGNKYILNGVYRPQLNLVVGYTYVFVQDDLSNVYFPNDVGTTPNPHPLNFSSDNLSGEAGGGTSYLEGVRYFLDNLAVTQEQYYGPRFNTASTRRVEITITSDTPLELFYWCWNHLAMGNSITVADPGSGSSVGASVDISATAPLNPDIGNIWFNSLNGKLYVYIDDADGSEQWVQPSVPTFSGNYADLTNRPNLSTVAITGSYNDLTDVPTEVQLSSLSQSGAADGQPLVWSDSNNSWQPASFSSVATGNFTFQGSVISTDDSSGISVTPALTTQSDLTVENDLIVRNKVEAQSITAEQFINNGVGAAVLESGSTLTLDATDLITLKSPEAVAIEGGPLRLPGLNTSQRDNITAANGDVIYNITNNKIQAYQDGAWINLDGT